MDLYNKVPRSIAAPDPFSGAIGFDNLPPSVPTISCALSEGPVHEATARSWHSDSADQAPARIQRNQLSGTFSLQSIGSSQSCTLKYTQFLPFLTWRDFASTYSWHSRTRNDINSDQRKWSSWTRNCVLEGFGFFSAPTSLTSSAFACRHRIIGQSHHRTPFQLIPMNPCPESSKEDLCPR